jgi:hypothetical protein
MHTSKAHVCQENYLPVGILYHICTQDASGLKSEAENRWQQTIEG